MWSNGQSWAQDSWVLLSALARSEVLPKLLIRVSHPLTDKLFVPSPSLPASPFHDHSLSSSLAGSEIISPTARLPGRGIGKGSDSLPAYTGVKLLTPQMSVSTGSGFSWVGWNLIHRVRTAGP